MINYYRLEQQIERAVAAQTTVGFALAVIAGDAVVYARGFGRTSVEDGSIPVAPNILFCFGSISKTLTAILVMRLVEQGRLDLDTPVLDYLPGFQFSDPVLGARVTLRHVLSHTSGLPTGGKDWGPRDPDALRRFVYDELARYPFIAPPGRLHFYSNTAIVLAGHVAEAVTGRTYAELMQELVFEPLAMRRTTFDRLVAMTYPLALAHEQGDDGMLRTRHRFTDNVSGDPAGFGIGSTLDLANVALMVLNGGQFAGRQFLSPASIALMQQPHGDRHTYDAESHYGLGWYVGSYKGVRRVHHGGLLESYNCYLTLFPERGLGVVAQSNYDPEGAIHEVVTALYDELLGLPAGTHLPRPVAPDRSSWAGHSSSYLSTAQGLATVSQRGDALLLEYGGETTELVAVEGGLYLAGRTPVAFLSDTGEHAAFVMIDSTPFWRYTPDPGFVPDPQQWERYAGTYELFPFMRDDARRETGALRRDLVAELRHSPPTPALIHGDFGGNNILYNPAGAQLTGVIDFGAVAVGDPAVDIAALSTYGEALLDHGFAVYPEIAVLLPRARRYRATFALQQALWALRGGDEEAFEDGIADYR